MAISPISKPSVVTGFTPSHPKSTSARARAPDGKPPSNAILAEGEEKAARDRITYAHEAAKEAEKDAEFHIQNIKDTGDERRANESVRQETALEDQKRKGYEAMQKLKRENSEELTRIRTEGDAAINQARRHYAQESYGTETLGKKAVHDAEIQSFTEREGITRRNKYEQELIAKEHAKRVEDAGETHREKFETISSNNNAEYQRYKENAEVARQKSLETSKAQLNSLSEEHLNAVDRANQRATGVLNKLQADSSRKLAAYSDRSKDPFYQMISLDTKLTENEDAYHLTAQIPVHEQGTIAISVHGDQLVVSGHRKNHEERKDGPGHKTTTSGYQSYSQTIPLSWPVDQRLISREFQGETLHVRIPKKDYNNQYNPYKKPLKAEGVRVAPPKFPDNLPVSKTAIAPGKDDES